MQLITWWFFKLVGKGDILPIWPVLYSKILLHPFSTSHGTVCSCYPFSSRILYCYPHPQLGQENCKEVTCGHCSLGRTETQSSSTVAFSLPPAASEGTASV